jgi:hypothetical protein
LDIFGIGGIGFLVLGMVGLLILIGLVKLLVLLWKVPGNPPHDGHLSAEHLASVLEQSAQQIPPDTDAGEQHAARDAVHRPDHPAASGWVARSPLRTSVLFRRALAFLLVVALFVLGYQGWAQYRQSHPAQGCRRARNVVQLTSVEMWTDAISQFDDIVRIRFRYSNTSDRDVDAFNARFELRARDGHLIIKDQISCENPVAAGASTSWTEKYWSTCDQKFSIEDWHALTHRDIADFEVEWWPEGLVFSDGEIIH